MLADLEKLHLMVEGCRDGFRNMHFKGFVSFTRIQRRTEIKDLITCLEQQKLETGLP